MSTPLRSASLSDLWTRARSRGFGWRSLSLVLAGFVAVLAVNAVSLWTANVLIDQTAAVEHTREVRRALDRTERSIVDAVMAQRGYLLSGQASFLEDEVSARAAAAEEYQALHELLRDNPDQSARLDDTRPLIDERLAITQQIVRDAREGRFTQALQVLRSGRGAELLQQIQIAFDEIDQVERAALGVRQQAAARAEQANLWSSTVGTVLIVIVAALAIFQFSLNFQALMRAHDELDEANRGLEQRVEERTQELRAVNSLVERARDRAEAMLREVNHRVGNSLQLVSSFISLQSRTIADLPSREAFRATQARIEAVSQVHRRLYTSDDMTRVELDGYLTSLTEELSLSLCAGDHPCSIAVEAEELSTTTDRAVAVGVLVAELVTNAVKYAYPGGGGEIRVRLQSEGETTARLTVEDDGVGVADGETAPKGTGLGKTIIAAMARDLRTEVAYVYGPAGLGATLVFDL